MSVTINWTVSRDTYGALLAQAGQSNLLQSWAWGEAKAEAEHWHPRRAILALSGAPIAVVQIFEKRLGPLRLARLNRGPLWLSPEISDPTKAAALLALRDCWRWWKAGVLLSAPELPDSAAGWLPGLGFRPRPAPLWHSAWVDLRHDETALRKALNGKWRNMLVNAEKSALAVDALTGAHGVDWLLPHYRAMMVEKNFAGVSPPMLDALARHLDQPENLLTLRARAEGEDASAVLIACHGAAATYLIGWNGETGRRLRGNYLLLWRAMLDLKARGIHWLDLGGIDATLTPGVAAFKHGLNGTDYTLAGEYLSL